MFKIIQKISTKPFQHTGFSLAEILITLAVIGIVAAMAIPSLLNKVDKEHQRASFKKIFAELAEVEENIKAENGGTLKGVFINDSGDTALNILSKHLSSSKICINNSNCWPTEWYYQKGEKIEGGRTRSIILNSGALFSIVGVSSSCTADPNGDTCAFTRVDVNGLKKPNTIGKDIFYVKFNEHRLEPSGLNDTFSTDCGANKNGQGCALFVLKNIDY